MSDAPPRGVIGLLTAQAVAFGVMLALLVIPANSLFLDAYGSKWLPATYIAIAVLGSGASALVARSARRTRLARVATASLLALAVLYAASWLILIAGGVWVSALLLVLFPIALQMGFVFIGGQAGRLLDVRQMKARFPRVLSGFAVGFLLGGLLGIPLLSLLGSTENLLLATTTAQLAFLGLLLATERQFPEVRAAATPGAPSVARPSARTLFASGIVLLLLVYQVLSAMGSQVLDYLLFSQAQAHYAGDELTRFLSAYTAVLNLADILFLALFAGPLMRRFGLRLGLVLNPAVVALLLAVMSVVVAGPGAAVYGLFVLAAFARLADIVLTDGTTRTSVNASFQVVPIGERLAVQAFVEGVGVPVAIGATGVVLLAANVLGQGTGAVVVFGVILSVFWTASAVVLYRSYTSSLAEEMQRRSLTAAGAGITEDDAALQRLLASDDATEVRLGLDLLAGTGTPASEGALRHLATHADPDLRVHALVELAASGDPDAGAAALSLADDLARSADPAARRAAAAAVGSFGDAKPHERTLVALLDDADPTVRSAALDAVTPAEAANPEIVTRVLEALEDRRTAGSATAAVTRLGAPAAPLLAKELARDDARRRLPVVRAAAQAATKHGLAVIAPALQDRDRSVVLAALDALAAVDGAAVMPPELLDGIFDDATMLATRAISAQSSLDAEEQSLRRALDDEIDLARALVIGVLALRYGSRVRDAVRVVECAEGQRRALGVEALDVLLSREEAAVAVPLVTRSLAPGALAGTSRGVEVPERSQDEWLADLAEDPEDVWRTPWLAHCAVAAASRVRRPR